MLNLLQAEILKQRKLTFIKVVTLAPVVGVGILSVLLIALKLFGNDFGPVPTRTGNMGGGLIGYSSGYILNGLASLYSFGLVLVAGQAVNNEYNWSTIKMLATREPSRTRIILSKALFMVVYSLFILLIFIGCWLFYAFVLKIVFNDTLGLTEQDSDALGRGLEYIWPTFLGFLVWSLLSIALTTRFKSVVGAFIAFIVYSTVDGLASSLGVAANHGQLDGLVSWLKPIVAILKIIGPFLINTNITRLTNNTESAAFLSSLAPVQSLLVLVGWGAFFTWLAVLVFNRRDITD